VIARSDATLASTSDARWRHRLIVAAAASGVIGVVLLLYLARWHNPQPYRGDEPHYLVVANSLITDGDVDVKNDYLNGRYLRYYPYGIDPHVNTSMFTVDSAHWYPLHGVGLSAFLVPALVVDDTKGASAAMTAVAALLLLLAFFWARRFTADAWSSALAAAALGISPFFLGLEGRIFADLATATLLLGCLLILELPAWRAWHLLLLAALIGVAPWFHFKNALAFGTLAVVALVQIARRTSGGERTRKLLLLGVPVVLATIAYELAVRSWYGSWLPTRMIPPGPEAFAISPTRGVAAASFDAVRGLLANNPALMLIWAGLPLWLIRWRYPFLRLMLIIGPAVLVQATFNNWHGGFAPPGRYALQYTPALIPAIAILLREAPRVFRVVAGGLFVVQFALAAAFVWLRPAWAAEGFPSPFLTALDSKLGWTIERVMPSFDPHAALVRGGWQLAAWTAASAALFAYGVLLSRRRVREVPG
jgi:hypothetical protein